MTASKPHFRLGAPGMMKPLYSHPKVATVMERAHQTLDQTRGPLSIRENTPSHDGVLRLVRSDTTAHVDASWERNPNGGSHHVPYWVSEALATLGKLRKVTFKESA